LRDQFYNRQGKCKFVRLKCPSYGGFHVQDCEEMGSNGPCSMT